VRIRSRSPSASSERSLAWIPQAIAPRSSSVSCARRVEKRVSAWAVEGDLDVTAVRSNTFVMEWPPGSGRAREFPEVDRAGWFSVEAARRKLVPGQVAFIDRLAELLGRISGGSEAHEDP
jgi:predicted NUDIX family NTP pyrophosphohydrolase